MIVKRKVFKFHSMKLLQGWPFILLTASVFFPAVLPAQTQLERAELQLRAKQYPEAYDAAARYLKQFPDNDTALVIQAHCLSSLKRTQEAYDQVSRVISRNPKYNRAYYVRGLIWRSAGSLDEARNDLKMAARNLTDTALAADVYRLRATIGIETRNFTACIADARKVLEYLPEDGESLNSLGLCFCESGQYDTALTYFGMLLRKDSVSKVALNNMGYAMVRAERYEEAIPWLNKAIELDGNDSYARSNRGYARYKLGELPVALQDIEKSIAADKNNAYAYRNRALIFIAQSRYDQACTDLRTAIRLGFREAYGDDADKLLIEYCK